MINYAYQIQVRDTEDAEWMDADMMLSPPGHAPQTLLKAVYGGHENLIRIQRIKQSEYFLINLQREVQLAVFDADGDVDITFEDRTIKVPREALG